MPSVAPGSLQACLDYLHGVSCDQGLSANNPCGNLLGGSSGNINPSTECPSAPCAKGNFCNFGHVDVDLGVRTCSTCQPARQVGQSCASGDQCADGLYCDDHFNTSTFLCASPAPDGTACYENSPNHSPCTSGFCNFRTTMCDPNGNEGDPCTTNEDCRANHCNTMFKCEHLHAVGEACTGDADCADFTCDPTTHTCGSAAGTPCMQFGGRSCAGFCDTMTNVCASPKPLGASCNDANECQSMDCAQTSFASGTRTCQVHCDDTHPCPTGQVCTGFQICQAPQANGSVCESDAECTSGHCSQKLMCADKPAIGAACGDSSDCFPIGYCSGGKCATHKTGGAPCDAYDSCLVPYVCLTGTCTLLNLTCTPAPAGQQCTLLHVCDAQSYCDLGANFTCKPRLAVGQMCNIAEDQCQPGLFCSQGKCAPRLGAGSMCTMDSQCLDGNYCVIASAQGMCAAAPAGQPCNSFDTPCPDGWFCPSDKCVAGTQQKGQSCTFNMGCVAGLACIAGTCQEKLAIGQECSFQDANCLSGHCDRSADVCLLSAMCM
jgi:hypothetical protein